MRLNWVAVLLVLLTGCGTTRRVVRLDTGHGKSLVRTPRGDPEPVKLSEVEFKRSLAEVARDVRPAPSPLRYARALMFESWQEEVYLEWTGRRLVLASPEASPRLQEQDEFTRSYGRV